MSIQLRTENLLLKPFMALAMEQDATLTIEAISNPSSKNGTIRGNWCFGLEAGSGRERKSYKLVTSSTAQTLVVKTPNGIFGKVDRLGFLVVKIPWRAGEQSIYKSHERSENLRHLP